VNTEIIGKKKKVERKEKAIGLYKLETNSCIKRLQMLVACSLWCIDQRRDLLETIKTFAYSEYIKCRTLGTGQTSGLMGPRDRTFKSSHVCGVLLVPILMRCRQIKSLQKWGFGGYSTL
jgi:hypothetical protein